MHSRWRVLCILVSVAGGCNGTLPKADPEILGPKIAPLNEYRNSASLRCAGAAYRYALGRDGSVDLRGSAEVSGTLLQKGYGTGSLQIGVTTKEKTQLAELLGKMSADQVERFLGNYERCMNQEMDAFYRVSGMTYPEAPQSAVVWDSRIHTASNRVIANRTGTSGNWRTYQACVDIPKEGLMLQDSVATRVVSGVPSGSWGGWKKDVLFVNNNAYGPTKVCRDFDHQIHDHDRTLEISVNYKLPK